jgi:hypothetical protein
MKTAHRPERNRALSRLIGEGLGPASLVGVAIPLAWRLGMKGLIPRLGARVDGQAPTALSPSDPN